MTPTAFAFFDFDDTLARGDSILPYLLYCIKRGLAPKRQFLKAAWGFLRWKVQPSTGRAAKELTLSFIKGRTIEEMDEVARDFFREVQSKAFFEQGIAELWKLREQGMKIVVVSASSDVYMRVLPEFLPVDAVISTVCQEQEGVYTGKVGKNCKGEEKVQRIKAWLREQKETIDRANSAAYGDSASDAPMMALVSTATLVDPKRKLRKAVPGGRIVRWH